MTARISDSALWRKIMGVPRRAGCQLLLHAIVLWLLLRDPSIPLWAKALIVSALTYFITPVDLLPDFLPTGYGDDAIVLASAMSSLAGFVNDTHRREARRRLPVNCR